MIIIEMNRKSSGIAKVLIISLILINILLLYKIVNQSSKLTHHSLNIDYNNSFISSLKSSWAASYFTNGQGFPNLYLKNLKDEKISLYDIIQGKKTLLLVYSEVTCNTCIDSLIFHCNSLVKQSNGNYKVVGIAFTNNINYLRRFDRINSLYFPMYWDSHQKLKDLLKIKKLPAILIINSKGIIVNSFFTEPNLAPLNSPFFEIANSYLKH